MYPLQLENLGQIERTDSLNGKEPVFVLVLNHPNLMVHFKPRALKRQYL